MFRCVYVCFMFFLTFSAPCASSTQNGGAVNVTPHLTVKGIDRCIPKAATRVFTKAIYADNYDMDKGHEYVASSAIEPIAEGTFTIEFSACPRGTRLSLRPASGMLSLKDALSLNELYQSGDYAAAAPDPVYSNSSPSEDFYYFYVGALKATNRTFVGHVLLSIFPEATSGTYGRLKKEKSYITELSTEDKLELRYVYYTTASAHAIKTAGDATLTFSKVDLLSVSLL